MKPLKPINAFDLSVSCLALIVSVGIAVPHASAWASKWGSVVNNPFTPIHTSITDWAIKNCMYSNTATFNKEALIEGSNMELHELPTPADVRKMGASYGVDVEAKRIAWGGSNAGCNRIGEIWKDAKKAYAESLDAKRQGYAEVEKKLNRKAFFLLGIMLHMIEDMGVPAHAKGLVHQGTMEEYDYFEMLAFTHGWDPKFNLVFKGVPTADPGYDDPSKYYNFSREWTLDDAPNYNSTRTFARTWITASSSEQYLLHKRQGCTAHVTKWALDSAIYQFKEMKPSKPLIPQ
jgi:hypothetical protein